MLRDNALALLARFCKLLGTDLQSSKSTVLYIITPYTVCYSNYGRMHIYSSMRPRPRRSFESRLRSDSPAPHRDVEKIVWTLDAFGAFKVMIWRDPPYTGICREERLLLENFFVHGKVHVGCFTYGRHVIPPSHNTRTITTS